MSERQDDMWALTEDEGPFVVAVRSDEESSLLGSYWNAVQHYLDTGDEEALIDFRGVTVGAGGSELETNPAEIEYWARVGELDFTDIYHTSTNA